MTGVQTCALPISGRAGEAVGVHTRTGGTGRRREAGRTGHLLSNHPQQEGWRNSLSLKIEV